MTEFCDTFHDLTFVNRLLAELEEGRSFALASILSTRGSMPRHAGTRMALLSDGSWLGTVGGGRIELTFQDLCKSVLAGETTDKLQWVTRGESGMACGGDALVGVVLWKPSKLVLLRQLRDVLQIGGMVWLVERWSDGGSPDIRLVTVDGVKTKDMGRKSGIDSDIASLCSNAAIWNEMRSCYVEPISSDPVIYLFGGGHIGRALCPLLASVGFRVTVYDDRESLAIPENFPTAERVIYGDFKNIEEKVQVNPSDYVVISTHGHVGDIDVLEQVSRVCPVYVGCLGSLSKAVTARDVLVKRGVSRAWADSVHMPVGEDIFASTPVEIAISIVAEIIRCRAELRPGKRISREQKQANIHDKQ